MKSLTFTTRAIASKAGNNALLCILFILGMFSASPLMAQCPLPCGNTQLSVNGNCEAEINPATILTGNMDATCVYRVIITDLDDNLIAETEPFGGLMVHPTISISDGTNFKASVAYTDANGDEFSCWSFLTLEDKLAPAVFCFDDITVACTQSHSDDLMTTNSQCQNAIDTLDLNPAAGLIDLEFEVDNDASPWEMISSASLDLGVRYSGTDGDFDLDLTGPDGQTYAASFTLADSIDLSEVEGVLATEVNISSLEGIQTLDIAMDGVWTLSIMSGDIASINSAVLCLESTSLFIESPEIMDNCSGASIEFVSDFLNDVECEGQFDPICAYERVISYRTVDGSGNYSAACNFTICYNKPSVSSAEFVFPANVELSCQLDDTNGDNIPDFNFSAWDLNQNGYPDPSDAGVGYPSIDGIALVPGEENLCKLSVAYTDNVIDVCPGGGSYKVLRTWTILDWCEGTSRTWVQTIKVTDDQPPFLVCPADTLTFEAAGFSCLANVTFSPLDSLDKTKVQFLYDCSDVTFQVEYLTADDRDVDDVDQPFIPATNNNDGTFTAVGIPADTFWVKYIATDNCGNVSECRFEAFVKDNGAPYAICDQFTAVALSEDGWARAEAISFDDGSYDACTEDVTFQVRRATTPCSSLFDYDRNDTQFGDYVQFCCADASEEYVQVILLVTDASGNTNSCMVNVEVQDKFGPTVTCPEENITINCNQYDEDTLYGTPNSPTVTDNCIDNIVPEYEDNVNIDDFCETGTITRRWYYTVGENRIYLDDCTQRITINSDFNGIINFPNDIDVDCSDVSTTVSGPTVGGVHVSDYVGCANLAYAFEDQRFYNVDGLCFKIIRTHTVIDWCTYVPNSGSNAGYYVDIQVIKVSNSAPPSIQECADEISQSLDDETCMNNVRLNVPWGYDDCLDAPILPHDMAYNVVSNGQIVEEVASISTTDGTITLQPLPKGTHTANFFIYNSCNNPPATCSLEIVVTETDTIPPVPYCFGGITTVLMNQTGESLPSVEIWASDFNIGATDNCTDSNDLVFTFEDGSQFLELGCQDEGIMTIAIYVTDECGNSEFCETSISIQANGLICDTVVVDSTDYDPNNSRFSVAGSIFTEKQEMIQDVEVVLNNMNSGINDSHETNNQGHYLFDDVLASDNYMLEAANDKDYLNGVSTLDLVLIQRHILGIGDLDSPYKIIAADANNSQTVSALDLIELRKLILGIYDELPSNNSWRFVDSDFVFVDSTSPWPFTESISFNEMTEDLMSNDFIAVKIGDVNNNVVVPGYATSQVTSRNASKVSVENVSFKKGDIVSVPMSSNFDDATGLQFALNYDFHMLEFTGFSSDKFALSKNNYRERSPGMVLFSWNDVKNVDFNNALNIEFRAIKDGELVNASMIFVDEVLNGEIYNNENEVSRLSLEIEGQVEAIDRLRLLQNKPNPFSDLTNIGFYLPTAGKATISILDLSGKLIYKHEGEFNKGFNELGINSNDIKANGLLYYQLDTEFGSETKKMLLIK